MQETIEVKWDEPQQDAERVGRELGIEFRGRSIQRETRSGNWLEIYSWSTTRLGAADRERALRVMERALSIWGDEGVYGPDVIWAHGCVWVIFHGAG